MFVLGDGISKEVSRRKALFCKSLVVADDVERGCEVLINAVDTGESGVLSVTQDNNPVEGVEAPLTFLVNEFGLFGWKAGLKSKIQVALCDGAMLITLIEGAIAVRLDGRVLVASRGISEADIPPCHLDTINWVSVNSLTSLSTRMNRVAPLCDRYPFDYIFTYIVGGENSNNDHFISIQPDGEAIDISSGKLTAIELAIAERERVAKAKLATQAVKTAMDSVGTSNDDLDFGDISATSDSSDEDDIYML